MRSLEDTYIYLVIHFKAQALMQKKPNKQNQFGQMSELRCLLETRLVH